MDKRVGLSSPDRIELVRIAGSYAEFAERSVLPEYQNSPEGELKLSHPRDGFEVSNANKTSESIFQGQTKKWLEY